MTRTGLGRLDKNKIVRVRRDTGISGQWVAQGFEFYQDETYAISDQFGAERLRRAGYRVESSELDRTPHQT